LIAVTIKKILKMKGQKIDFYMVPQIKLKEYTTTKQDAPKGMFKRPLPEYLVPDNEEPPVIIPPAIEDKKEAAKIEEKKIEETKAEVQPTSLIERKQTLKPTLPSPEPEKPTELPSPSFAPPEVPKPSPP